MPSRRLVRFGVVAALLASCGCDRLPWPELSDWTPRRQPSPTAAVGSSAAARSSSDTAVRYFQVTQRLATPPQPPTQWQKKPCPDAELDPAQADRLWLDVRDARFEGKQLLPLVITEQLRSRPIVETHSPLLDDPALVADTLGSAGDAAEVRTAVEQLERQRYKAVFHVLGYSEPKLIRRLGKAKREWLPGVLSAALAVHELETGRVLCQTQILVARNDVSDAPLGARLRSTTRDRFVRELGERLRQDAAVALAGITRLLALPQ